MPAVLASAALAAAVSLAATRAAAQQCRNVCMPDEVRDAAGCCQLAADPAAAAASAPVAGPGETSPATDPSVGCLPGQSRSEATEGRCCWPGQRWAQDRCAGVPSVCPAGFSASASEQTCALSECAPGRERQEDGVTCCWPGQSAVAGRCHGLPAQCPEYFEPRGDACEPMPLTTVTIRAAEGQSFSVAIETSAGRRECRAPAEPGHPCVLRGVARGPARVVAHGTSNIARDVTIAGWNQALRLEHTGYAVEGVTAVLLVGTIALASVAAVVRCDRLADVADGDRHQILYQPDVCIGWVGAAGAAFAVAIGPGIASLARVGHHDTVTVVDDGAPQLPPRASLGWRWAGGGLFGGPTGGLGLVSRWTF